MPLSTNYTFFGRGNWSLDAVGGAATSGGVLSAIVPEGSTIQRAFLYASNYNSTAPVGSVTISYGSTSTTRTAGDYVALGTTAGLQAYRTDITSFVTGVVGNGDDATFDFNISNVTSTSTDGFILAVVYANPDEQERTITLLDGVSQTTGDNFSLSFDEPIDPGPGYSALFSLGIGYGFQGTGQFSQVTVNGRPLTTSAGGSDDGTAANGGLITVGGIGDSAENPADPNARPNGPRSDDELYDLAQGNAADGTPFLPAGTSTIVVNTLNPSNDDNIFFAGFNITDRVIVDTNENDAPIAVADGGEGFTTSENTAFVTANVLANDSDPEDDALTITGVDTSTLVGTLVSNGDGTFTYNPDGQFDALNDGESATTSFTYTISDGEKTASSTVTITITGEGDDNGPDPDPLPDCPVVQRAGTVNGTPSADQVLTGIAGANTFYFAPAATSGDDTITNFGSADVLVTNAQLRDANGDGFIGFGNDGLLDFDSRDSVAISGVDPRIGLRYLGESCEGVYVYAEGAVRPQGAIEGLLGDSALSGDAGDATRQTFFFDTALEIDLGSDSISNFGARDFLVTTSALDDANGDGIISFGANRRINLPGESGDVSINGGRVTRLEFDGSSTVDGVLYYYYSLVGLSASFGDIPAA